MLDSFFFSKQIKTISKFEYNSVLFSPAQGVSMVISKNGVEFHTKMEKALFTAHARQMIPTLCGIPLDLCLQSTVVAKMDVDAVVNAEGLLLNPFNIKKVMVAPHIKLR